LYLFLQQSAHPVKNWSGAAHAAPLRLKLNIFLPGAFFVLSVQSGAVHGHIAGGAFLCKKRTAAYAAVLFDSGDWQNSAVFSFCSRQLTSQQPSSAC
ncbi:hypothetical protein, partial [Dysosmobacter sp.]|uniref:hypothetical protein n=1 Tax=Dysosmobacter sp. TaxID=2591382 RepID=UPI002A8B6FFB